MNPGTVSTVPVPWSSVAPQPLLHIHCKESTKLNRYGTCYVYAKPSPLLTEEWPTILERARCPKEYTDVRQKWQKLHQLFNLYQPEIVRMKRGGQVTRHRSTSDEMEHGICNSEQIKTFQLCLYYTNKTHIYNKIHVLIIILFSSVFQRLLHHLQEERFCMLNYHYILWLDRFATFIRLLENHVCFNVKLKMLQTYVITKCSNSFEQTKEFSLKTEQ